MWRGITVLFFRAARVSCCGKCSYCHLVAILAPYCGSLTFFEEGVTEMHLFTAMRVYEFIFEMKEKITYFKKHVKTKETTLHLKDV